MGLLRDIKLTETTYKLNELAAKGIARIVIGRYSLALSPACLSFAVMISAWTNESYANSKQGLGTLVISNPGQSGTDLAKLRSTDHLARFPLANEQKRLPVLVCLNDFEDGPARDSPRYSSF